MFVGPLCLAPFLGLAPANFSLTDNHTHNSNDNEIASNKSIETFQGVFMVAGAMMLLSAGNATYNRSSIGSRM